MLLVSRGRPTGKGARARSAATGTDVADWREELPIDACGIGFGGPVIWSTQMVATSTHVGGWSSFDFPAWIRDITGCAHIVMDNDANVGALGEYTFGAGKRCSPMLYMTVSTGIGGGILIDGKVLRGIDSWAGEIGHMNVRPGDPPVSVDRMVAWSGCAVVCGLKGISAACP